MRAGSLRERVTFQQQGTSSTPAWGITTDWTDIASVWASVLPSKASEVFQQKGVASATQYTVTIRYRPDITSADRLLHKGKILDIIGVINVDGRNRQLDIEAVNHG